MNTFLINASNLKVGGGIQVAQSICEQISSYSKHRFIVVLSEYIPVEGIEWGDNTKIIKHNIKHSFKTIILGRDELLDKIVEKEHVDAVLTVFGPSLWCPRCSHLCGFARAQLLLTDSPYYQKRSLKERIIYSIWKWAFRKSSKVFYTESQYISSLLENYYQEVKVFTVSNYYNQVFDHPEQWKRSITLPPFEGLTCLSVSSPTSHKNFGIIEGIVRHLRKMYPDFKVRFVLTFSPEQWPLPEDVRDSVVYVGKTDVSECPYLYEQADIMFMPTLLECFSATYPEAMRMNLPIVTTDLEFARGLCGDAACYYNAIDAEAAAESIYKVASDREYTDKLVANGKEQLKKFDNYEQRAQKLIEILEEISK